ncbi:MAG: M23 family metallopeptidase [Nannocystaceae bacterium]
MRRSARLPLRRMASCGAPLAALAFLALPARPALATSTCYKLPFNNPNLADGWGSLCCGRTTPHRGVDFPQPSGTPIPAVADGVVRVKTWSSCLGNVVVLEHPDGMYSGYCHMVGESPLNMNESVSQGSTVGKVGTTGTCSTGPHLHLTMSDHVDGWGYGTTVDPYKYIENHKTCNVPPKGTLEAAGCDAIVGWAQDPSTPKKAIEVRFAYDGKPSDPDAILRTMLAELERADLCEPLGSCDHGFRAPTPLRLFDGAEHSVRVHGLDSEGGDDTQLDGSPTTFTCTVPAANGVLRPVADASIDNWAFSTFDDLLPDDPAIWGGLEVDKPLPLAPRLVRADDGSPTFWLLDGPDAGVRRLIPDRATAQAWRLDLERAGVWPIATIAALQEGTPLRARPVLVEAAGPSLFLVDDPLPPPPLPSGADSDSEGATSGDPHSSGDGSSGDASDSSGDAAHGDALPPGYGDAADAGCGCRSSGGGGGALALLLALGLGRRRRRR